MHLAPTRLAALRATAHVKEHRMYEIGTPIAGGIAGTAVLAYTGFDTLPWVVLSCSFLLGGLLILRTRLILQRRPKHRH
ncbi:hypothetical protein [Frondihabitans australicus]|nr:hypothetical protein [Frondihabitans australicus]